MAVTNANFSPLKFSAAADAVTGRYYVKWMVWVGATTAGHTIVVNDAAGKLLFSGEASGANFSWLQPVAQWANGITVATMASGYLLVYTG